MELTPTLEQIRIIEEPSNCVVIAGPGSGKTYTLACKIKKVLPSLPDHKGVVAISYTNRASDELQRRCLSTGLNSKGSFFGTIDRFFISEIIIPFGKRTFGSPSQVIEVVKAEELETQESFQGDALDDVEVLGNLFRSGKIVLERIGLLAVHILDSCQSCQRYIKARYTHVIIDEYQDCGESQHELFMRLVQLGLIGVAVGDADQSIFGFAGRSPAHLFALAQNADLFKTYNLSQNHRCHLSIINYSTRLLSSGYKPEKTDEVCVYSKLIDGSEIEVAQWLTSSIPQIKVQFQIERLSTVAILFKNRLTGNLVHRYLGLPHKSIAATPLDDDSSSWGLVFRRVLTWVFSPGLTKHELLEGFLHVDFQPRAFREALNILSQIEALAAADHNKLAIHFQLFEKLALVLFPDRRNREAAKGLQQVLNTSILLESFIPPRDDEVQLMTLHKSKGLEFDIVFHLNLYRWILPQFRGDYYQDLNLHYVGITRAKKCCVLCSSTYRHRTETEVIPADESEFLYINDLHELRWPCPV